MLTALFALSALAADPGIPLDPLSELPWQAAATRICGEARDVDGQRVMNSWWVRDASGRLLRIVKQQVGRYSIDEERFVYGTDGRLVRTEDWQADADTFVKERSTTWRDDAGKLVDPDVGHVGRDARGRIVEVHNGSDVLATVDYAADGRSAVAKERGMVLNWTFDDDGIPITMSAPVNGHEVELNTWRRDCADLPPVPTRPDQVPVGASPEPKTQ